MDREQIMAMEAGAEMDWFVVEAFFRNDSINDGMGNAWARFHRYDGTGSAVMESEVVRPGKAQSNEWSPSTDIAAAWEVVEKMREMARTDKWKPFPDYSCDQGPWFAVEAPDDTITHERRAKGKWTAGFRINTNYEGDGWVPGREAQADTAPLAICRAALIATLSPEPTQ